MPQISGARADYFHEYALAVFGLPPGFIPFDGVQHVSYGRSGCWRVYRVSRGLFELCLVRKVSLLRYFGLRDATFGARVSQAVMLADITAQHASRTGDYSVASGSK